MCGDVGKHGFSGLGLRIEGLSLGCWAKGFVSGFRLEGCGFLVHGSGFVVIAGFVLSVKNTVLAGQDRTSWRLGISD